MIIYDQFDYLNQILINIYIINYYSFSILFFQNFEAIFIVGHAYNNYTLLTDFMILFFMILLILFISMTFKDRKQYSLSLFRKKLITIVLLVIVTYCYYRNLKINTMLEN